MATKVFLKNGRVFDDRTGQEQLLDLAITDERITAIGKIDSCDGEVIDAQGSYVVPGLIDFHTHLFEGGSQFGFDPDRMLASGVTTAVDAGTTGVAGYEAMHRQLNGKKMRCYTFLNLSSMGQLGSGLNENLAPELVQIDRMQELLKKYPTEIRALKVRISRSIVGELGSRPLQKALRVAEELGLPVVVHSTDPCVPMEQLAQMLRPGDVLCHVFHGRGATILDENGAVKPELWEAQERGVWMDAANGRNNFSFSVAGAALKQGFKPDIISTDLTAATIQNGCMVRNLPFVMSKYRNMGMSMKEILERVTVNPVKALRLSGNEGHLRVGARADIAILSLEEQECIFADAEGTRYSGNQMLKNRLTMLGGRIVYDSNDLLHR